MRLGFDAVGWPVWLSTEMSILWNYTFNRRVTWRDRRYAHWWVYNRAAAFGGLTAIATTTALVRLAQSPVWVGSLAGIAAGIAANSLLFDRLVFRMLPWRAWERGRIPA